MNKLRKDKGYIIARLTKYLGLVLNFLASIASIIGLLYSIFSSSITNKYAWLWIIAIIFFVSCVISFVLLLRSEKYENLERGVRYASGFHEILHCLRDMNKSIDDLMKREEKMYKDDFLRMITSDCIDIMNKMSTILSDSTQCKIRSCIKLNDFIKDNENDPTNMKLITFARNGHQGANSALSEQRQPINVTDNTDFEYIFSIKEVYAEDRKHYFYKKDLKKFDKQLRKKSDNTETYKNSDKFWRKRYNTTIVMPMRCLVSSNINEAVYDIVGFLCVDARKANAFEKRNFHFTIEFLKGVSDILYSYLNSCITYYRSIGQKQERYNA